MHICVLHEEHLSEMFLRYLFSISCMLMLDTGTTVVITERVQRYGILLDLYAVNCLMSKLPY